MLKFKKMYIKKVLLFLILIFFVFINQALSADLYISPQSKTIYVGDRFSITIYVDSPDKAINAVSFKISYPNNLLKVESISKTGSLISLWAQDPKIENGVISGEGVILNQTSEGNIGFTGSKGKIIKINFKAIQEGIAEINFISGSVLANDGQGTNILKNFRNGSYTIEQKITPVIIEEEISTEKNIAKEENIQKPEALVDKIPPKIEEFTLKQVGDNAIEYKIIANDVQSGIDRIEVYLDDKLIKTFYKSEVIDTIINISSDFHSLKIKVYDKSKNETEKIENFFIKEKYKKPTEIIIEKDYTLYYLLGIIILIVLFIIFLIFFLKNKVDDIHQTLNKAKIEEMKRDIKSYLTEFLNNLKEDISLLDREEGLSQKEKDLYLKIKSIIESSINEIIKEIEDFKNKN